MNPSDQAIITPKKNKHSPHINPLTLMISTPSDLEQICKAFQVDSHHGRPYLLSNIYTATLGAIPISIVGPFIGAPYAAILLENIIAWGGRQIILVGWCGSICRKTRIGDIILPTAALIDEGTSANYLNEPVAYSRPSWELQRKLKSVLSYGGLPLREGRIWTTDAIYRETRNKITRFQDSNAIAVDMETSALFSIARFREVHLSAVLVVSDELFSFTWNPGFKHKKFIGTRNKLMELLAQSFVPTKISSDTVV